MSLSKKLTLLPKSDTSKPIPRQLHFWGSFTLNRDSVKIVKFKINSWEWIPVNSSTINNGCVCLCVSECVCVCVRESLFWGTEEEMSVKVKVTLLLLWRAHNTRGTCNKPFVTRRHNKHTQTHTRWPTQLATARPLLTKVTRTGDNIGLFTVVAKAPVLWQQLLKHRS